MMVRRTLLCGNCGHARAQHIAKGTLNGTNCIQCDPHATQYEPAPCQQFRLGEVPLPFANVH